MSSSRCRDGLVLASTLRPRTTLTSKAALPGGVLSRISPACRARMMASAKADSSRARWTSIFSRISGSRCASSTIELVMRQPSGASREHLWLVDYSGKAEDLSAP